MRASRRWPRRISPWRAWWSVSSGRRGSDWKTLWWTWSVSVWRCSAWRGDSCLEGDSARRHPERHLGGTCGVMVPCRWWPVLWTARQQRQRRRRQRRRRQQWRRQRRRWLRQRSLPSLLHSPSCRVRMRTYGGLRTAAWPCQLCLVGALRMAECQSSPWMWTMQRQHLHQQFWRRTVLGAAAWTRR